MSRTKKLSFAMPFPALELAALISGETIAALPRQSLNKGKAFALYPVTQDPEAAWYQPHVLTQYAPPPEQTRKNIELLAWAECEMCETIADAQELERLADCTIWTPAGLVAQQGDRPFLFVAYLRVHAWVNAVKISPLKQANRKLGRLVPLKTTLDNSNSAAIFAKDAFEQHCQNLQQRQGRTPEPSPSPETDVAPPPRSVAPKPTPAPSKPIAPDPPSPPATVPEPRSESQTVLPDWTTQIAAIGNSSNGHEFERLVRRSFGFLGFRNTQANAQANLDPDATGGAGGLDFYADQPYGIVGECKATKTEKVPDATAAELIKLGLKILPKHEYDACIKLIIAAGELTKHAEKTAVGNQINVLRPETVERLVGLKRVYPGAIDLWCLKDVLKQEPFGAQADQSVNGFVDTIQAQIKMRQQIVEIIKQNPFGTFAVNCTQIHALFCAHNRENFLSEQDVYHLLIEMASPLLGYIGHQKTERRQDDRFYFLRDCEP